MDLFPDANMINTIHLRSDNNCETYSCKMHYASYSACTGVWTDDGDYDKNDEGDDDDDDLDDGDDDDKNDDDDDDDNDDGDDDDDDDTMLINQIARPLASTSGHFLSHYAGHFSYCIFTKLPPSFKEFLSKASSKPFSSSNKPLLQGEELLKLE